MNMRLRSSRDALPIALGLRGAATDARVVQAAVVPVAAGIAAVFFDLPGDLRAQRGRLGGTIGGAALPRPVISARLALRGNGWRHVILLRREAGELAREACRFDLGGVVVAVLDPAWLQSPLRDPVALVEGLSEEGRHRLMRMLLTTGASLTGAGRASGYAAALSAYLDLIGAEELRPVSVRAAGATARLLTYAMAGEAPMPQIDTLVALSKERVSRVAGHSARLEETAAGRMLHVFVPQAGDGSYVGIGPGTVLLGGSSPDGRLRALAPWLAQRDDAVQEWVRGLVARLPQDDKIARAVGKEIAVGDAASPELLVRHLSAVPGGVLMLAELRDPARLAAAVRLEAGGQTADIEVAPCRGVWASFVKLPGVGPGASCEIAVIHGSGRVARAGKLQLEALGHGVPPEFADREPQAVAGALAAAFCALGTVPVEADCLDIGEVPARPGFGLVIRAGAGPDLLRARLAMLASEPGMERVEVVHFAQSRAASAVQAVLTQGQSVYGIGGRLVVVADEGDETAGLRAALGSLRASAALVLGEDVLPQAGGWLGHWRRALRGSRGPALVGGVVLGSTGEVRAAGGRGLSMPWNGLPAAAVAASGQVRSGRVSAMCVGMRRAAIEAFCRQAPGFPQPDVMLMELARRLGAAGRPASATLLAGRCVAFGPPRPGDDLSQAIEAHVLEILARTSPGAEP